MAISIAHWRNLDERVERLAAQLDLRGRKTAVIKQALSALRQQVKHTRPGRDRIEASLERLARAGDRYRERERTQGQQARDARPASQVWQEELYDDRGLPR